jgi:hypothetical protein
MIVGNAVGYKPHQGRANEMTPPGGEERSAQAMGLARPAVTARVRAVERSSVTR